MEDWISTKAQLVWPLVMQEPWTFATLAVAIFVAGWVAGRFMWRQRIEDLKSRLERRDEDIKRLEGQAGTEPMPDPDAITQHGVIVGKAFGVMTHFSEGYCTFERIEGSGDFNPEAEFEYRGRKFKFQNVMQSTSGHFGAVRTQAFAKVTANVVS